MSQHPSTLCDQVKTLLAEALPSCLVTHAYPNLPSPLPAGKICVCVSLGDQQDTATTQTTTLIFTVTVPFVLGSASCVSTMQTIQDTLQAAELEGYRRFTLSAMQYDKQYDLFTLSAAGEFENLSESLSAQTISFGELELPCLAETIQISCQRAMVSQFIPLLGETWQDLGRKSRTVTVNVQGTDAQYQTWYEAFCSGASAALTLPNGISMTAMFRSLDVLQLSAGRVQCQIVFTEVML